jgi:hypothetical protein
MMKLKYSILMMLYALICKFAHFMKIYCRFTTVPKRKFAGAVIGWIITTPIALGLNILKGVVTFGNNDFSILRTDGEERLLREIVLIRTLEAISVLRNISYICWTRICRIHSIIAI